MSRRRRRHDTRHSMRTPTTTSRHGVLWSSWSYVCSFGLLCMFLCAPSVQGQFVCSPSLPSCNCTDWYTEVEGVSTKVQNISCSMGGLYAVPEDGKEGDLVFAFDLSYNNITSITADDFQFFTRLQHLNLSYNSISSINVDAFDSLTNLLYLDLEGNDLTDLPNGLFSIKSVIFLNLAVNPNIVLPDKLTGNSNLQILDISRNELDDLPEALFQHLDSLVSVDVSYNALTSLKKNVLKKQALKSVDFSHNQISVVDPQFINKLSNLVNIDHGSNSNEDIEDDHFSTNYLLQKLDLSHNNISELAESDFLKHLDDLIELDLSYNEIGSLPADIFKDANKLNIIYLNNNKLTRLPNTIFNGLNDLMVLNVKSNLLTTLDTDLFSDQGSVPISLDLSDNKFTCECTVHSFLYQLKYDTDFTVLNEENVKCVDAGIATNVYLDWFDESCNGILGSSCSTVQDCAVRNAECNETLEECECSDQHYDNNEVQVLGGICKPIVGLGDPCDNDGACVLNNAQHQICSGTNTYHCMCDDSYYDDNGDHLKHGECQEKVNLGYPCTMLSMCGTLNSYCDPHGEVCACQSAYYDDNFDEKNGTCVDKLPLYEHCTQDGQCDTDNSKCGNNQCICNVGYYDLDNAKLCLAASEFYSCFYDEDYGTNNDVEFSLATDDMTEVTCHTYCFTEDQHYMVYTTGICLCGEKKDKKQCCPYVTAECNTRHYLNESYMYHVTTGLTITAIPTLTVGLSHQFTASATLAPIDQIKWTFGDSDAEHAVDDATATVSYTYTYAGPFTVSVSACIKSSSVCETAQLPVKVQVPNNNLTTYLTGYTTAKVSQSMTDVTTTFSEGSEFDYYWYKTDSSGAIFNSTSSCVCDNVLQTVFGPQSLCGRRCPPDWQTHRHTCVKLLQPSDSLANAMAKCITLGGRIFKFDFMDEVAEVTNTLAATADVMIVGAERVNGVWQWKTDASKTVFSYSDLTNPSVGDCVVIDGPSKKLTTIACSSSNKYICMTDPVDCPYGKKHTDGRCFVFHSALKTYTDAEAACATDYGSYGSYGARLALIDDSTVHDLVTTLLNASSSAWFGLSDLTFDGYHTWSDNTAFAYSSAASYKPIVDDDSHSCFTTTSSKTWTSLACFTTMPYICEYSVNTERASVQSMVAGATVVNVNSGGNLHQIVQTAGFTSTTDDTEIILFPGMWFTRAGEIRSFVFHSVDVAPGDSYQLALQVYRPVCPPPSSVVQPACADSRFATCLSSSPACSSSLCSDATQHFCYLGNQCKPYSQSCTCTSETSASAVTACNSYTGSGTEPSYVLQGQTQVTVSSSGENYYTVPAGGISVSEHDFIGIEHPKDKNVIKCENSSASDMQQTAYKVVQTGWLTKFNKFPSGSKSILNTTCYLQAIYTQDNIQNMTHNLGYSTVTGTYELAITLPTSSVTKKLSTTLEEAVGNVEWISPPVKVTPSSSTSLGTVNTEYGVKYYYILRVGYGTSLESIWSFETSTTVHFQPSCPSMDATSIGNPCNASLVWSDKPFAFMAQTISVNGTSTLTIEIKNTVDTQTWDLTIKTEKRIAGLSLVSDSTALVADTLKVNDTVQFTPSITAGTGESYSYAIDGSPLSTPTTFLSHSFSTAGSYGVEVTAENILSSETFTLPVDVKIAANFTNCQFKESSYVAAKDTAIDLKFECKVTTGADMEATWWTPAEPSIFTSAVTTGSAVHIWIQAFTFTAAPSNTTVNITVHDAFQVETHVVPVNVYNGLPSLNLSISQTDVLINETVRITATVADSPGHYGSLTYSFDLGDGTLSSLSGTAHTEAVTHTYTSSQVITVTVTVTNGPSTVTGSANVTVYETVDGCSLTYDGPSEVNTSTSFTASTTAGTFVSYRFVSDEFNTTVTTPSFTYSFDTARTHEVKVVCLNSLSQKESSIDAYILDSSQITVRSLTIVGGSFTSCVSSGQANQFQVDVIHYDTSALGYLWDFGDGPEISGGASESHTYASAGTFNVTVTVAYSITGTSAVKMETICVQELITSPTLSVGNLLGLAATGSTSETISVIMTTGTDAHYVWTTNATVTGSTTASSLDVTFSAEGFYEITCTISNEVSSESVAQIVELVELITDLAVNCASCVTASGLSFMTKDVQYILEATIASGTDVAFTWNFADGSAVSTGTTQTKHYTSISHRVITVLAKNRVTTSNVTLQTYIEEPLASVDLDKSGSVWEQNKVDTQTFVIPIGKEADFEVKVLPSGMDQVTFNWVFYAGATPEITKSSHGSHNYATVGPVTCVVDASNSLNSISTQYTFYAIDQISSINVTANGSIISSGDSVVLNKLYVFKIITNSQVNNTQDYFLKMKMDGLLDGSINVNEFQYTFLSESIEYKLTAQAENNLGMKSDIWLIKGMHEISSPNIMLASGDGNITQGASVQLTGGATGTLPQYSWQYSQAPSLETFPTPNDESTVTLTPNTTGTYIIQLDVYNDVSTVQSVYITIKVVEQVTGVSIAAALTSADAVKVNSTVDFSADVVTGSEMSYEWNIFLGTDSQVSGTASMLTYMFDTQAVYNITLDVWNYASSGSAYKDIYSLYEIADFDVNVAGSTIDNNKHYIATGQDLTFTSSLTTLDFLEFDWLVDNGSEAATNSFVKSFGTPDTYDVKAVISNKIDTKANNVEIIVQDEISNLSIDNCPGTYTVGDGVTLKAEYMTGTDVNIHWEQHDLSTSNDAEIDVQYSVAGVYGVKLTGSNYIDTETFQCNMSIFAEVKNLQLTPSKYKITYYTVTFSVNGENLEGASYKWTFSDGSSENVTTVASIDHTFTTNGTYKVDVEVSNPISNSSTSIEVEITNLKCSEPVLTRIGDAERTAVRARNVELGVSVDTGNCADYTTQNEWVVYYNACTNFTTPYTFGASVHMNMPTFQIPALSLAYGSYCAVFVNSYNATPVTASVIIDVKVVASSLKAMISGGHEVVSTEGTSLTLDGSGSSDPDQTPATSLTYTWACVSTPSSASATVVCDAVNSATSPTVTLTSLTLTVDDVYTISLTVSATDRKSHTTTQIVHIVSSGRPVVTVICISCVATANDYASRYKNVALKGSCTADCDSSTTYEWTITTDSGNAVILTSEQTTTSTNGLNLAINDNVLEDNTGYTFMLTATTGTNTGWSAVSLEASSVPSHGSCTIPSTNIEPLSQQISVVCRDWQDADPTMGLRYSVVALGTSGEYILYHGRQAKNDIYIAPWPATSLGNVQVKVTVLNDNNAGVHTYTGTVQFTAPILSAGITAVDFIVNHLKLYMPSIVRQNNPHLVVQYCTAVLLSLNEQSAIAMATGGPDVECAKRAAIRDLLSMAMTGLPKTTLQDILQVTSAVTFLTAYPIEAQSQTIQWAVVGFIDQIAAMLSTMVKQGDNQRDFKPDNLLMIVHSIVTSFAVTESCGTSQTATLFPDTAQYIPQISISQPDTTYASDYVRKQTMVEKSSGYNEQVLVVSLMSKMTGETPIEVMLNGQRKMVGVRELVEDIQMAYSSSGATLQMSQSTLNGYSGGPDVLQVMQFGQPVLEYGYQAGYSVNTVGTDVSFYHPDGTRYLVTGLQDDQRVKMYLFNSEEESYEINGTLFDTADYNPRNTIVYFNSSLVPGTTYSANLTRIDSVSASGHYQVRVVFPDDSVEGELSATLYKDAEPYTVSDGEHLQPKTITREMMADGYDHRRYTFTVPPGEATNKSAFSVRLSTNTKAEVYIGQYFTLCQFYNRDISLWDSAGCTPDAGSIPICAVCYCNHMTSYGAALRLSPDFVDFSDLTRLDIPNNPVAIITCSILLVLYVVIVIVCRRLDHLDVKRISTIPLCGKDGSFKYEVTVVTGRLISAGTTAHVGIRIIGEYGKSARQHIFKPGAFQRNCADMFIIAYDVNLGSLQKIEVWHDNTGPSPAWYLNQVVVKDLQTDKKYFFFANKWLTLEDKHGCIQREIKAADPTEMMRLSRRVKSATFTSLADQHIWLSMLNRPAQSRFTRVQRATCCMTLLYTFIGVNAMWYGLLKSTDSSLGWGSFGWEEVVLGLVSNLMVFPINVGIVMLFKKSRLKSTFLERIQKPQTAETLEIENLCGNSQSGSFQSSYVGVPYDLERESTIESVPHYAAGLHRSRHVNNAKRDSISDTLLKQGSSRSVPGSKSPMWNQDSIMNWPEKTPFGDLDSRPSTSSTIAPGTSMRLAPPKPGAATPADKKANGADKNESESEELLDYLNKMESELSEPSEKGKSSIKKSSLRRPTAHKSNWGSLEDIMNSDDESSVADSAKRLVKKRGSTASSTYSRKFNPRADPRIAGNTRWPRKRESLVSSTIGEESLLEGEADQGITSALRPAYFRDITTDSHMLPAPAQKEGCTLPPWCVYVAYVLCFLLSAFSVIIVILYCFKFGYNESLEWVLACLLSLVQSVILFEPIKVMFIAVYVVTMFRNVEEKEADDTIDIARTYDTSNEKIKDVKFKPISGFALMQAREDGRKVCRLKEMLRQFVAYVFYLWLLMVIIYVNFQYSNYLLTKTVEHNFIDAKMATNDVSFRNISSITEFWEWNEGVFVESLHLQDTQPDEEHGFLLGAARMRLIRSTERTCEASSAAASLGAAVLTNRTCYGTGSFEEDTKFYGEGWNESSYNLSWKHQTGTQLGGGDHHGHMGVYGGGGYSQVLGTSQAHSLTLLQHLRSLDWIDLRARAVFLEWSVYSPGSDTTATAFLLVEFPLTGGVVTSHEIQSQKLLWFQENRVDPLIICEIILLLVVTYSLIHIALTIRNKGRQFFKDWWNWYEMLTTLLTTVAIGMYIGCVVEATNTFNSFLDNQAGFTNFERVAYVHVAMRYIHACLLFLLMFKVVKQLRFIKFLYVYERTLSNAVGLLLGAGLIFLVLLMIYAQLGHLMYGRVVAGFQTFGHTMSTLMVMIRGTFDFWPLLDHQPIFSHFYVYSYYAFVYGFTIALVISILNSTYRMTKSQMFFKATMDMRDHEMVDFMLKRFKLWAGITKPKPAFRKVKFQGLPSLSSRSSSRYSSRTSTSLGSSSPVGPEFSQTQLNTLLARLGPTWQAVLWRLDKIVSLDTDEEKLVTQTESEAKELNWKIRINELERQRSELLNWKSGDKSDSTDKPPLNPKRRQEILKKLSSLSDTGAMERRAPATVSGASRTALTPSFKGDNSKQGKRPISDQGARIEPKPIDSSAAKSVQKFFQSVKPSKPAWDG